MKYVCSQCGKLMELADVFAFDGESYYCSLDCYHEKWDVSDDEEESEDENLSEGHGLTGAIDDDVKWWKRF
jgi:hypothetical protein